MILGGEISYGLYLIHDAVQRYGKVVFEQILKHPLNISSIPEKTVFMVATTIISLALAYVSWVWLEMPARRWIRDVFYKTPSSVLSR